MSYVLSVIYPPVAPAAYGRAETFQPASYKVLAASLVQAVLIRTPVVLGKGVLTQLERELEDAPTGTEIKNVESGLTFRIDDVDTPPNACPCCGRLVRPEDAMFAGDKGTLCDGCYPYGLAGPVCLPANSAHTEEP